MDPVIYRTVCNMASRCSLVGRHNAFLTEMKMPAFRSASASHMPTRRCMHILPWASHRGINRTKLLDHFSFLRTGGTNSSIALHCRSYCRTPLYINYVHNVDKLFCRYLFHIFGSSSFCGITALLLEWQYALTKSDRVRA
jgi:hypothetical protein